MKGRLDSERITVLNFQYSSLVGKYSCTCNYMYGVILSAKSQNRKNARLNHIVQFLKTMFEYRLLSRSLVFPNLPQSSPLRRRGYIVFLSYRGYLENSSAVIKTWWRERSDVFGRKTGSLIFLFCIKILSLDKKVGRIRILHIAGTSQPHTHSETGTKFLNHFLFQVTAGFPIPISRHKS